MVEGVSLFGGYEAVDATNWTRDITVNTTTISNSGIPAVSTPTVTVGADQYYSTE